MVVVLAGVAIHGCGPDLLKSNWLSLSAVVQGGPDWQKTGSYRFDDLNGTAAMVNDSSTLYFRFTSNDRRLAQRFRRTGLTIWITNPLNKHEKLGVGFPVGRSESENATHADHLLPSGDLQPAQLAGMLDVQNGNVLITSPDSSMSGRKTHDEAVRLGIITQLSEGESATEYQLRVTMGRIAPWIKPGSRVLVEVDSPAGERKKFNEGEEHEKRGSWGGMRPGGGDEGEEGGGGFPGRGMGRRHGREHEAEDQPHEGVPMNRAIHLQFELDLARAGS